MWRFGSRPKLPMRTSPRCDRHLKESPWCSSQPASLRRTSCAMKYRSWCGTPRSLRAGGAVLPRRFRTSSPNGWVTTGCGAMTGQIGTDYSTTKRKNGSPGRVSNRFPRRGPRLSTRRAEKRSPAADDAGDQSLRIVLRINLGSFTSSGRVALARIGFRFLRKREILSFRLLQNFSFSPPVVERDPCADEEHHHDNRN